MLDKHHKKKSVKGKIFQFIQNADAFGLPISLTYKKDPQIKSVLGGAVTIIARLGIIAYLLYQCSLVLSRDATIKTSTFIRDLINDQTEYSLGQDMLDIGFFVEYANLETESDDFQKNFNIFQYLYPKLNQNTATYEHSSTKTHQTLVKVRKEVETEICTRGRLGLTANSSDYLGMKEKYLCPKNYKFQLKGSQASQVYQYVQLQINTCNQTYLNKYYKGQSCATLKEQKRILDFIKLFYIIENSFLDVDEFSENPVKKNLRPFVLYSNKGASQHFNLLMSLNEVTMNDNMVYGKTKYSSFVETRLNYVTTESQSDIYDSGMIVVNIQVDEQYKVVERQVFTFIMALSNCGGLMSAILVFAGFLVARFERDIYNSRLIKSFYKYQSEQSQQLKGQGNIKLKDNIPSPASSSKAALEDRLGHIIQSVAQRRKLFYDTKEQLKNSLSKVFGCVLNQHQRMRQKIYQNGKKKLEDELDIRTITKEIRTLKFISSVVLNKRQRFLIPYNKGNLLNTITIKDKIDEEQQKQQLQKYLKMTLKNDTESSVDKRILKQVFLSDNEDGIDNSIMQLQEGKRFKRKSTLNLNNLDRIKIRTDSGDFERQFQKRYQDECFEVDNDDADGFEHNSSNYFYRTKCRTNLSSRGLEQQNRGLSVLSNRLE